MSDLELINKMDEDTLKEEVVHYYPKVDRPGYIVSQILRFAHSIKKGDIVLIPSENSTWINIGEVQNNENIYMRKKKFEDVLDSLDGNESEKKQILKNVKWIKSVKKSDLDPSLYSIIYSHAAVANVKSIVTL